MTMRTWSWICLLAAAGIVAAACSGDEKRVSYEGSGGDPAGGSSGEGGAKPSGDPGMDAAGTASSMAGANDAAGASNAAGEGPGGADSGGAPGAPGDGGANGNAGAAIGGMGGDGDPRLATLLVADSLNGVVHRFAIEGDAQPALIDTISAPDATGLALNAAGELFVARCSAAGEIRRFLSPLAEPEANGSIVEIGTQYPQAMSFVDDELWVANASYNACDTGPQSIVRLAFDGNGVADVAGSVDGLIGANRGMMWSAQRRELFVSQCYPVNTIQRFEVDENHAVTPLPSIAVAGNPHGMVLSKSGELIVALAGSPVGGTSLARFTLGSDGSATSNGTITGNGINVPIGLVFAPWGELFVVNQGDASLSRFTFDNAQQAVPNGNFALEVATQAGFAGVGWTLIAPAPPP